MARYSRCLILSWTSSYNRKVYDMSRCTAPVHGHRSASARAACPACGSGYSGYGSRSYSSSSYAPSYSSPSHGGGVAVAAVHPAAQSRAGRNLDPLWPTLPPRYERSHRYGKMSRGVRQYLIYVTSFFVTPGTTGKDPRRSCMMYSSRSVFPFGSARKMSF